MKPSADSLQPDDESVASLAGARSAVAAAAKEFGNHHDDSTRDLLSVALGSQYQIIRELGRGGMGAVYLAREKALERLVAIKVLKPELAGSHDSRERFRREARIVANLSHPGILQLHTFGDVGGVWFFVMSYVRGESLADLLRRRNRLPWTEAHRILVEVADALTCAHRYPVIHRDIKPANILIEAETGRAILTDFGISKLHGIEDSLTASGAIVGTPHYMSPEQTLAQGEIDERSDIYSLGAVAYRMLAGREPFTGASALQLMYARLSGDPEPVHVVNPDVPQDIADAVMKCLAREPSDRWSNATALRDALVEIGDRAVDRLPEGVRDIPSYGPYALIWFAGFAAFATLTNRTAIDRTLLLIVAALVPLGLALHVWLMGVSGVGTARFIGIAMRPPDWWSMYWPRIFRRPADVWPRLPFPARLSRIALSVFFVVIPGVIVAREVSSARTPYVDSWLFAVQIAAVLFAITALLGGLLWARQRGLGGIDTLRLLTGSTSPSSGWTSPDLSRLLAPNGGKVRVPEPHDPDDYARAIRQLAEILPSRYAGLRLVSIDLVNDALAASRQNRDEVDIGGDTPVAEADRLQARLNALGPATERESSERAEMRDLLEHQLKLQARMRDRFVVAADQDARRFDRMKNLYVALCRACDGKEGEGTEVSGSVLAACADLRAELEMATS